jgi:hypothetical protein
MSVFWTGPAVGIRAVLGDSVGSLGCAIKLAVCATRTLMVSVAAVLPNNDCDDFDGAVLDGDLVDPPVGFEGFGGIVEVVNADVPPGVEETYPGAVEWFSDEQPLRTSLQNAAISAGSVPGSGGTGSAGSGFC